MILGFRDGRTAGVFNGVDSKAARSLPQELLGIARGKLDMLNAAGDLKDLLIPPGNRLETLKGDLKGPHSIRINDQFRVVFRWLNGNAEDVRIVDYH